MKIINRIIAFLVGVVFIFSGTVKLIDPVGMEIKLEEYFEVFAADTTLGLSALSALWEFLMPYSLSLAIILSLLEVGLGFNLILFRRMGYSLWALFFLVVFFGFLTFYSAYFDKVTDCGCFGDAIKLSPWGSFIKDLILGVGVVLLLIQFMRDKEKEQFKPLMPNLISWIISTAVSLAGLALAFYAIWYLPVIDFRSYKVGASIPEQMKPAEELKYGKELYTYINLETGEEETFETWEEKLADTTKYEYKSYEKPLLNPEALPKITDYLVSSETGEDVTETTFKGKVLFIIIQDIQKAPTSSLDLVTEFLKNAPKKSDIKLMIFTGNDTETFKKYYNQLGWKVPFFFVDMTVLKTMIRSNPGIMFLENGTIKGKYPDIALPEWKDLK